jgi:hypothetical protein
LNRASKFLLHRYLGYKTISEYLTDDISAYERDGARNIVEFIGDFQFPFPVESIKADAINSLVKVDYCSARSTPVFSELLYFDEGKIKWIQTTYIQGTVDSMLPRPTSCGGADSEASVRALKSCQVLNAAMGFLKADVTQDLKEQEKLLVEDAVAFGVKGRDEIIRVQKEGIDSGTTYSVPYPIIVDPDATCVTLDFNAHKDGVTQKGTDIMYVDLREEKIVRIDTLRHTLNQPEWVRQHFSGPV